MRGLLAFLFIACAVCTASAQQQQSNAGTRLGAQIGALVIQVETQRDVITELQSQLQQAQAEVKRLREQYEPAPKKE